MTGNDWQPAFVAGLVFGVLIAVYHASVTYVELYNPENPESSAPRWNCGAYYLYRAAIQRVLFIAPKFIT